MQRTNFSRAFIMSRNHVANLVSYDLAFKLLRNIGNLLQARRDLMNRELQINPLCVASLFLALGIVTFLILHPMNQAWSAVGDNSILSFFGVLLHP